jgi:NAD(P)-dependent dehydrogenase (short-subunit alcohol dehydrogenase family)
MSPNELFNLTGRVALVTGGATGIGLMITRGLVAAGAKVYIAGRRQDVLDKAVRSFGSNSATVIACVGRLSGGTCRLMTLDVPTGYTWMFVTAVVSSQPRRLSRIKMENYIF